MKLSAYTIFDTKGLTYSNPFFAPTHAAAVRIVKDAVSDPNTSLGRHPADYVLYCCGTWDDSVGAFDPANIRDHIVDLVALVPAVPSGGLFSVPAAPEATSANGAAK